MLTGFKLYESIAKGRLPVMRVGLLWEIASILFMAFSPDSGCRFPSNCSQQEYKNYSNQ